MRLLILDVFKAPKPAIPEKYWAEPPRVELPPH